MTTAAVVKERPILFSGPMVRALLAGTKTQTRRLRGLEIANANPKTWALDILARMSALFRSVRDIDRGTPLTARCPYGDVGDRLWVRETWMHLAHVTALGPGSPIGYRADLDHCGQIPVAGVLRSTHHYPWRPSIHMPRWACRIVLEITEVRAERLQAISEGDAMAEGVERIATTSDHAGGWACPLLDTGLGIVVDTARLAYHGLWNEINGAGSWEANPWVWALTFKRVAP